MLDEAGEAELRAARQLADAGRLDEASALCRRLQARYPDAAEPRVLVADLSMRRGEVQAGLLALEAADRCGPSSAFAEALRAEGLAALRQFKASVAAAVQARARGPTDATTWLIVGSAFASGGRAQDALDCFRAAAALQPEAAAMSLATQLHTLGETGEAEHWYREALKYNPTEAMAWHALAHLRSNALDTSDMKQISHVLDGERDLETRLMLAHALAKAFEDSGAYDPALHILAPAKRAKREALRYSFEHWDAPVFAAAHQYGPAPANASDVDAAPILIVGMPRTGTTLIERTLATHSEVESLGETNELATSIMALAGSDPLDFAGALKAGQALDPAALGARYIEATRQRQTRSAIRLVDKMPTNFFFAGLIHRALPNARIVIVRRSAMDAVASNYMPFLAAGRSPYCYQLDVADTARQVVAFDRLATHWRTTLPAERLCEIHYEKLVENQEAETRRLLYFCGLPWEPACLDFHRSAEEARTLSSVQVRSRLYATSIGRWRRYARGLAPAIEVLAASGLGPEPARA
jgi:tetratricopeptide (TPR) repeat protein